MSRLLIGPLSCATMYVILGSSILSRREPECVYPVKLYQCWIYSLVHIFAIAMRLRHDLDDTFPPLLKS